MSITINTNNMKITDFENNQIVYEPLYTEFYQDKKVYDKIKENVKDNFFSLKIINVEFEYLEKMKNAKTENEKIEINNLTIEKIREREKTLTDKQKENVIENMKTFSKMKFDQSEKEFLKTFNMEAHEEKQKKYDKKYFEKKIKDKITEQQILKSMEEDTQEWIKDLKEEEKILKEEDAKIEGLMEKLSNNETIIENVIKDLKTSEAPIIPPKSNEIGKYADLTNYPAENNQYAIEFNSYKPSRYYDIKKDYQKDTLLFKSYENYAKLKNQHHEIEKRKKAIIRKNDLTLFECVIKFDKEQFNRVLKAKALNYDYYSNNLEKCTKRFISDIFDNYKFNELDYCIKEEKEHFEIKILFYNYDFKNMISIERYLKLADRKIIKTYLKTFELLGFNENKTKRPKKRITKNLQALFDSIDKRLEQDKINRKKLSFY